MKGSEYMLPSRIFFDDFMDDFHKDKNTGMKMDIYEKDNKYVVEVDAPGYKKDDIKISCENGYLTIEASKKQEEKEDRKYLHRERTFIGRETRQVYVGDIDEESIDAEFKDGTLIVTLDKEEKKKETKYIDIK
jgi:HSP20 family molecular chaperone IbpA